jgi:polysaccharide pyruvyl transferase WcaK-like protein
MDVVVTTRLHGLVLALKRGIPALAIDPIDGGAKVRRQATVLGWPAIIDAGDLSKGSRWLDWCLSADAREEAGVCAARAQQLVHAIGDEFVGLLTDQPD